VYRPEYVSVEQMPHYFVASDLVAIPYAKTYQSGILALAYAAGRAVLVTDTGGLAEVVEPGKSGFIAPPCDADAMAEALIEAGTDPHLLGAMGRYGKRLADTKYSWNDIAISTLSVYQTAIERRRMNHRKEANA
jgi:glycosyltransferase involved in cell wall biosynthesis